MKRVLAMAGLCGLLALGGTARAQNGLPEPPAELKKMQFLVGKFRFTTHLPSQDLAAAVEFRTEGSWISNGWQLMRRETSTDADGTLETTQIISYDAEAKLFRLWWFSPGRITDPGWKGHLEGQKLVFDGAFPIGAAGFAVSPDGDHLRVYKVFPKSAAERAGVKEGDVVAWVNDQAANPNRFSGKPGTTLRLVVMRAGWERQLTINRERAVQRLIWEPHGPGSYRLTRLMGVAGAPTEVSSIDWSPTARTPRRWRHLVVPASSGRVPRYRRRNTSVRLRTCGGSQPGGRRAI